MKAELQGTQSVRRIVLRFNSAAETVLSSINLSFPAVFRPPGSVDIGADLRVVPAFAVYLGLFFFRLMCGAFIFFGLVCGSRVLVIGFVVCAIVFAPGHGF